jgi:hypothetical protein
MKTINLDWKDFNVNLSIVSEFAKILDESCCGISANSCLQVHFLDDTLSNEKVEELKAYWDSITEDSEEAQTYKSQEQLKAEAEEAMALAKASAVSKLKALGLSDAEILALGR